MATLPFCSRMGANAATALPPRRMWAPPPGTRPCVHVQAAGGPPQQQVQVEQPQIVPPPSQAPADQQTRAVPVKAVQQVQSAGRISEQPAQVEKQPQLQTMQQLPQQPQTGQQVQQSVQVETEQLVRPVQAAKIVEATPVQVPASKIAQATEQKEWKDMTLAERKEMLALFTPKRELKPFVQLDHVKRRREREMADIVQAAKKHKLSQQQVEENVAKLESLLPDLLPNLDKMKASDWVLLIKDPDQVAVKIITLKSFYPSANLSKIISRNPKVLLQDAQNMQADAKQVRSMLSEKLGDALDAVITECPDLMRPAQAALSINNLKRWFPKQDPFEILKKNPSLLNNIEEADLQPDPTYGWESNYGWLATLDN